MSVSFKNARINFDPLVLVSLFLNFFHFSVMTTATPEKADGLKALQNACDEIQKTITNSGGVFQIKMAVCVLKT